MEYEESLEYIANFPRFKKEPSLEEMKKLLERLGNPQEKLRSINVAGTNGKGSVGAFLESVIKSGGRTVGRFVSPFVFEYLETFTLNSKNISPDDYAECVISVKNAVTELNKENIYPTAFEAETAIAFLFFKKYAKRFEKVNSLYSSLMIFKK